MLVRTSFFGLRSLCSDHQALLEEVLNPVTLCPSDRGLFREACLPPRKHTSTPVSHLVKNVLSPHTAMGPRQILIKIAHLAHMSQVNQDELLQFSKGRFLWGLQNEDNAIYFLGFGGSEMRCYTCLVWGRDLVNAGSFHLLLTKHCYVLFMSLHQSMS